jgi:hypothetical protein
VQGACLFWEKSEKKAKKVTGALRILASNPPMWYL